MAESGQLRPQQLDQRRVAKSFLEHAEAMPKVDEPPRSRQRSFDSLVASGCGRDRRTELANLRDLVRREDHQRLGAGGRGLLAERSLALCVPGDHLVLADSAYELRDRKTKARSELGDADVRLLQDIVKDPGSYHTVQGTSPVQQPSHLARVLDERGAIAAAALPRMLSLCVPERGPSLWKARYHIGQKRSTGHDMKAYSDPPICEERQSARETFLPRQRGVSPNRAGCVSDIGCNAFAARAARELGLSGEKTRHRPPAIDDELTRQELQVAQFAPSGPSNREIAERLFLSHRTIASHLYHVYPKLGITSRNQLHLALEQRPGLGHAGPNE